ncbi:MAG: histidine kinase N-terminal 7TM domain-containing protein, partial [Rariglobus sp.]
MSWQITLLLFSAAFEVVLLLAIRNRLRPTLAGPFCLGLLLNALWALNYALDLSSTSLEGKLWMLHVRSTFLPFYTVVWFETAFRFSLGRPLLRGRLLAAALVVPVVTAVLCWVPGGRDLLYYNPWIDTSGAFPLLRVTSGSWTPVYNFYNYLTGLAAIVVLFRMRPRLRAERISWFLFVTGSLLALIADILYELNLPPT